MKDIRAVVFDAVGTLMTPDPPVGIAYHSAGRRYGSRRSVEEVVRRFGRALLEAPRGGSRGRHGTDEAIERVFWRGVVGSVFDDLPAAAADACFECLFDYFARPEAWRVYADVGPAIQELRRRGLAVAVGSNFDARLHAVFDGHADLAPIRPRFVSSEIGWRKPDPRFFLAVCAGLGHAPNEVLYLGDEPDSDVAAAAGTGMRAVLLRRKGPAGAGVIRALDGLAEILSPTSGGEAT